MHDLTPEQVRRVVELHGFDPEQYTVDESATTIIPKSYVQSQSLPEPSVSDSNNFLIKGSPAKEQDAPLTTAAKSAASSALPAVGGGIAAMGMGSLLGAGGIGLTSTGPGALLGIPLIGLAAYLGSKGVHAAQEAVMPESWQQNLQQSFAANPKSALAGSIATMPLGGMSFSPTGLAQAGAGLGKLGARATGIANLPLKQPEIQSLINVGAGAGLGAGIGAIERYRNDQPIDVMGLLMDAGLGAAFNKQNSFGNAYGRMFGMQPHTAFDPNNAAKLLGEALPPAPPSQEVRLPAVLPPKQPIDVQTPAEVIAQQQALALQRLNMDAAAESGNLLPPAQPYVGPVPKIEVQTPKVELGVDPTAIPKQPEIVPPHYPTTEDVAADKLKVFELQRQELLLRAKQQADADIAAKKLLKAQQERSKGFISKEVEEANLKAEQEAEAYRLKQEAERQKVPIGTKVGEISPEQLAAEQAALAHKRITGKPPYDTEAGLQRYSEEGVVPSEGTSELTPFAKKTKTELEASGKPARVTPEYLKFMETFNNLIRGIKTKYAPVVGPEGKRVPGVADVTNKDNITLDPSKVSADTPPHEAGGHILMERMLESSQPRDKKFSHDFISLVEKSPEFAEYIKNNPNSDAKEFIATDQGAEFLRRSMNLGKENIFTEFWKDVSAYWRTRYGKHADVNDYRRILNYEYLYRNAEKPTSIQVGSEPADKQRFSEEGIVPEDHPEYIPEELYMEGMMHPDDDWKKDFHARATAGVEKKNWNKVLSKNYISNRTEFLKEKLTEAGFDPEEVFNDWPANRKKVFETDPKLGYHVDQLQRKLGYVPPSENAKGMRYQEESVDLSRMMREEVEDFLRERRAKDQYKLDQDNAMREFETRAILNEFEQDMINKYGSFDKALDQMSVEERFKWSDLSDEHNNAINKPRKLPVADYPNYDYPDVFRGKDNLPTTPYEDIKRFYRAENRPPNDAELEEMGYVGKHLDKLKKEGIYKILQWPSFSESKRNISSLAIKAANNPSDTVANEAYIKALREHNFKEYIKDRFYRNNFRRIEVDPNHIYKGEFFPESKRIVAEPADTETAQHEVQHFSNDKLEGSSLLLLHEAKKQNQAEFDANLKRATKFLAHNGYDELKNSYEGYLLTGSMTRANEIVDEIIAQSISNRKSEAKSLGDYFSNIIYGRPVRYDSPEITGGPAHLTAGWDYKTQQYYSKEGIGPEGMGQIDTPEFKKWFEGSKVVDSEGKPLVVYHGTNAPDFTKFRTEGYKSRGYTYGEGAYFTPEKSRSSTYSRAEFEDLNDKKVSPSRVYPAYVSLKNPFVTSSDAGVSDIGIKMNNKNPGQYKELATEIAKKNNYSGWQAVSPTEVGNLWLRKQSYDGIIKEWKKNDPLEVVAFYPEQIKSAIGNRGTFDPNDPDIRHSVKSIVPDKFKASIDLIENLDNPKAKAVAEAFRDNYRYRRAYSGTLLNDVVGKLNKHIPWTNIKGKFFQNTPDFDRVVEYGMDLDDYGRSSITLTPKQQQIYKIVKDSMAANEAAKNAIPSLAAKGITYNAHIPMLPSRSALNILLNKPGSAESVRLINDWMNYHTSRGMTVPEAEKALDTFMKGYEKVSPDLAEQYGPIDRANNIPIPRSWRETSLMDVVSRHANRVARRLAFEKAIMLNPDAHDSLYVDRKYGLARHDAVKEVMRDIQGDRENEEAVRTAVSGIVRAFMLGPLTGAKDFVSNLTLGMQHQTLHQSLVSPIKALSDIGTNIKESFSAGVNRHNLAGLEMGDLETVTNYLRRTRDVLNVVQGRNFLEQVTRATAYGQGKYIAADNIFAYRNGKLTKQGEKFLDDFGPKNWRSNRRGQFTAEELKEIASRYTESVQGTYDPQGLPQVARKGTLSPFLMLARWNIEKLNNFDKYVVKPALQGNYRPLLMQTLGMIIGGAAVNELVQLITKKKERTPTTSEIKELVNEGRTSDAAQATLYKAAGLASLSGYAGFATDIVKAGADVWFHNRPQEYNNPLVGAAADVWTDATDLVSALRSGDMDGDLDSILNAIARVTENYIQAFRIIMPHVSEDRNKEIEKRNKLRDLKMFKTTHDMPVSEPTSDRKNPFANYKLEQFKETSDLDEAVRLLPELIQKAFDKAGDSPERLKSELRKIKQNSYQTMPNPDEMPMAFIKYITNLKATQGDEAANARLVDYLTQRQVNKMKSDLVPSLPYP